MSSKADGVAIHGYDPVAYFADDGPQKGRPELAVQHGGGRWLFASEANKKRFEEDPEKYLPAFGGYCAYGVAQGYLVKIDPNAWRIVDDRLYLNYDRSVARTWAKDIARLRDEGRRELAEARRRAIAARHRTEPKRHFRSAPRPATLRLHSSHAENCNEHLPHHCAPGP